MSKRNVIGIVSVAALLGLAACEEKPAATPPKAAVPAPKTNTATPPVTPPPAPTGATAPTGTPTAPPK